MALYVDVIPDASLLALLAIPVAGLPQACLWHSKAAVPDSHAL
jgi:hypothetical protein